VVVQFDASNNDVLAERSERVTITPALFQKSTALNKDQLTGEKLAENQQAKVMANEETSLIDIKKEDLVLKEEIGRGSFAAVYKGELSKFCVQLRSRNWHSRRWGTMHDSDTLTLFS
jgi:hypothetical protein